MICECSNCLDSGLSLVIPHNSKFFEVFMFCDCDSGFLLSLFYNDSLVPRWVNNFEAFGIIKKKFPFENRNQHHNAISYLFSISKQYWSCVNDE